MILNYEQFADYIKKNGETIAKTTKNWLDIPEGTEIMFILDGGGISSWHVRNEQYRYNFDVRWTTFWKDSYKGKFEVEDKIPPYILCSTPELAKQVLEKIEKESDLEWNFGRLPTTFIPEIYCPNLVIETTWTNLYCDNKGYYESKGITNFTLAEDYLGVKKNICKHVELSKERMDYLKNRIYPSPIDNQIDKVKEFEKVLNKTFNYMIDKEINSCLPPLINKPKNKTMKNIIDFAKNIKLSKEEKNLRTAGLHDEDGIWTKEARIVVLNKKSQQLGYNDIEDMSKKLGIETSVASYSIFELHDLFIEFSTDLQDIADKYVKSLDK